jgi:hypothetical protein
MLVVRMICSFSLPVGEADLGGISSYPKNPLPVRDYRSLTALAVAFGLLTSPPSSAATPAAEPAVSSALREAIRTLASERQGVTAFHRHVDAEQHAPGHDASLDVQSGLLRDGDRVVAVRIYSQVANGKTASSEDLVKAQGDADKNLPGNDYLLPLHEDQLSDYRIDSGTCDQCPAGSVAIHFTSLKRDESHGDGTMVVDASHHIVRIDFVPGAFPKHVDKATVTLTFGRVLPDLWDVVEMQQHYAGHVLFISGGADITTSLSNYRRFASRDEATKALAAGI